MKIKEEVERRENMMWMDIRVVEKTIYSLRKKRNEDDCVEKPDKLSAFLPLILTKIQVYREEGVHVFKKDSLDLMNKMLILLTLEAQIISLINVAIYEDYSSEEELSQCIKRNDAYVFDDYWNMITYYAEDFKDFSFLSQFYLAEVKNRRSSS